MNDFTERECFLLVLMFVFLKRISRNLSIHEKGEAYIST